MRSRELTISYFFFIELFMLLYPILPWYFMVFGVSVRILLLLAVFFLLLLSYGGKFPKMLRNNKWIAKIIIIWAVTLTTIAVIHADTLYVITWSVPWLGLMPIIVNKVKTKDEFIKLIDFMIYTGGIVAVLAIFEEFTRINVFRFFNTSGAELSTNFVRMGMWRVISFTSHPITYSLYCMFIMCFVIYRISLPETKRKALLVSIYAIVFLGSLFTLSRSSIIVIILSQVGLLWLCGYRTLLKRIIQILIPVILIMAILCFVNKELWEMIQTPLIMVLAVFSDSYADTLLSMGYTGDTSGIADRFLLYSVVWDSVKDNLLIGFGPSSNLNVKITNFQGYLYNKQSIEVQLLIQLYRYGLFAAVLEVLRDISQIISAFKRRKFGTAYWEGELSFSKLCFILFAVYFIAMFSVMRNEDGNIFFLTVVLFMTYNANYGYGDVNK
ncbi:MAG: hypothetical protein ACRDBO_05045 [Lachnospiraceae bacterium]